MALLKSTDAKVVGITFKNFDGTDRQEILSFVSDGDPVTVQYYEFRGDPAYSVSTLDGDQIGNLSKELAADIRRMYGDCFFDAHISEIYYFDDYEKTGCRIQLNIYDSEDDIPVIEHAPVVSPAVAVQEQPKSIEPVEPLDPQKLKRIKTNRVLFFVLAFVFLFLGLVTLPVGIIFIIFAVLFFIIGRKATVIIRNQCK